MSETTRGSGGVARGRGARSLALRRRTPGDRVTVNRQRWARRLAREGPTRDCVDGGVEQIGCGALMGQVDPAAA